MSEPPPVPEEQSQPDDHPIRSRLGAWMRELIEAVLPALVIVLLLNIFIAQATRVEGQSMEPNLHDHQRLVIEKITYHFHPPERGDIVVLRSPTRQSEPLIKRVIGLPGETVEIRNGHVYIDGALLNEPYLSQETWGNMPAVLVAEDHIFVMGDNRGSSNDSRAFGTIPLDDVIGRAWLRYWPIEAFGLL